MSDPAPQARTVPAELRIVSSSLAGRIVRLEADALTLGRHPENELCFSPEHDLAISARHAVLLRSTAGWVLRDLGSRNGSYVNGQRITQDTLLRSGDRLGIGTPEATALFFYIGPAGTASSGARRRPARFALIALAAIGVGVSAAAFYQVRKEIAWQQERAQLHASIDSLRQRGEKDTEAGGGEAVGSVDALLAPREAVHAVRPDRKLPSASPAPGERSRAAAIDVAAITRKNRAAVALVYVEAADGEVQTGTAFAVRADATLLTNRHVVMGADGAQPPRRIAVQFSHSLQKWPARLLAVAEDADLALLKVDNIIGDVPVVAPFNSRADTLPVGTPVVLIGFPLGGEEERADGLARPIISAASVTSLGTRQIGLRGFGASGASGSPIFDAEGKVVAILYAGRDAAAGQALFAVPAAAALRLLEQVSSR